MAWKWQQTWLTRIKRPVRLNYCDVCGSCSDSLDSHKSDVWVTSYPRPRILWSYVLRHINIYLAWRFVLTQNNTKKCIKQHCAQPFCQLIVTIWCKVSHHGTFIVWYNSMDFFGLITAHSMIPALLVSLGLSRFLRYQCKAMLIASIDLY